MTLSILIPTLPERLHLLRRLESVLLPQVEKFKDRVQIIYNDAGRHVCIGQKRNMLMERVQTEYSVFIDDDDMIVKNYISSIIWAIDQNPDCVTFRGWMTTNGKDRRNFVIKLGEEYEERNLVYYRWPNHIVPMRTSLIRQVKFPHLIMAEDYNWSKVINDKKLLKTSVHLDFDMYHYDFLTRKPAYGTRGAIR